MINLIRGDCLEELKNLPSNSVDMVLADPPYGTTKCKWDSIIPLEDLWRELERVCKTEGAIVMTASQPFTTKLISSNLDIFKYCWVWEKPSAKGHLNAKKRPMVAHEDICVFYRKQPKYNPIKTVGHKRKTSKKRKELNSEVYNNNTRTVTYDSEERYPRSVQIFKQDTQKSSLHPTQKPLGMMEYLIKTYTDEGEVVLDFCMGSGTTGVACKNLKRNFVGIELNEEFFNIANRRINAKID